MAYKSGYLREHFTSDLKRAAIRLRESRMKEAFVNTDYTANVEHISKQVNDFKTKLADLVSRTNTTENDFKHVGNIINDFRWLLYYVSRYTDKITNKEYSSTENAEEAYNDIIGKLNDLNSKV
jgi:hypothetical protein